MCLIGKDARKAALCKYRMHARALAYTKPGV